MEFTDFLSLKTYLNTSLNVKLNKIHIIGLMKIGSLKTFYIIKDRFTVNDDKKLCKNIRSRNFRKETIAVFM